MFVAPLFAVKIDKEKGERVKLFRAKLKGRIVAITGENW